MQTQQNTTTTAVATKPMEVFKATLNAPSVQEQFKNALANHKDAFVSSLVDLYSGDQQLQKCKPAAVVAEAFKAATMNLPVNKALGFAYIVVYNNSVKQPDGSWAKIPTPTFLVGYKGLIQLAMRTGQYKTINADVVYEGEISKTDKLSGEITITGNRTSDKIIGYFCYFQLLNGFSKTLYMTVDEMARYAKRYSPSIKQSTTVDSLIKLANSTTAASKTQGWEGNFNDMALKTVIRRLLSKYGYLSVEMQNAITQEENAEEAERNSQISQAANAQYVDIDEAEVVENTEPAPTAVKEQPQQTNPAPAPAAKEIEFEDIPY